MVSALGSGSNGPGSNPGARFSKASETFRPAKPFSVICILIKTEKCIGLKLRMKETSVHIKNIME